MKLKGHTAKGSACVAGIGKSTLLGLISGALEPTQGTIMRSAKVRMAVFSQHHMDGLDLALTPLAYMLASFPNTKDQEHRCTRVYPEPSDSPACLVKLSDQS